MAQNTTSYTEQLKLIELMYHPMQFTHQNPYFMTIFLLKLSFSIFYSISLLHIRLAQDLGFYKAIGLKMVIKQWII